MTEPSEFEDRLDQVIRRRIPGATGLVSVERLSGGASQETYRLTVDSGDSSTTMAMRRAPGGESPEDLMGRPGLAVEAELIQVAGDHGVPEPAIHHVLEPDDGLGPGFVMEWLDGETLGARIVRSPELDEVRPGLAEELGRILARIHAVDLDATNLRSKLTEVPTDEFVERMWDRYKEYPTPQPMIDFTARWLLDNLPPARPHTLVHNDFRNGNVMVSQRGVEAVLDWEAAHIGDPIRDLGWLCTASWRFGGDLPVGGFGKREDLLRGYQAESGRAVDPAELRFWEVFGSFWWAVGCLGMAEHYRTGPDNTVERPAIGRRSSECQVDCVNLLIPGPVKRAEAAPVDERGDMPRRDELVESVRDFLRGPVMDSTDGRTNFLARVAGNSLDIVLRELAIGPQAEIIERDLLEPLVDAVGTNRSVGDLRWSLVAGLRSGSIGVDSTDLAAYLRTAVVNQVAIDQPRYPGLATALAPPDEP